MIKQYFYLKYLPSERPSKELPSRGDVGVFIFWTVPCIPSLFRIRFVNLSTA